MTVLDFVPPAFCHTCLSLTPPPPAPPLRIGCTTLFHQPELQQGLVKVIQEFWKHQNQAAVSASGHQSCLIPFHTPAS